MAVVMDGVAMCGDGGGQTKERGEVESHVVETGVLIMMIAC